MPSFMEKIRNITGAGKSGEGEDKLGKDVGLENPGMPDKEWQKVLAVAKSDPRKMTELRQSIADYQVRQAMAQGAGGREAYVKNAQESAQQERQRLEGLKEVEKSQLQLERQKQMLELAQQQEAIEKQRKIDEVINNINQTFAAEETRKQQEEARRERLGL